MISNLKLFIKLMEIWREEEKRLLIFIQGSLHEVKVLWNLTYVKGDRGQEAVLERLRFKFCSKNNHMISAKITV
jgi:hypothetical protein